MATFDWFDFGDVSPCEQDIADYVFHDFGDVSPFEQDFAGSDWLDFGNVGSHIKRVLLAYHEKQNNLNLLGARPPRRHGDRDRDTDFEVWKTVLNLMKYEQDEYTMIEEVHEMVRVHVQTGSTTRHVIMNSIDVTEKDSIRRIYRKYKVTDTVPAENGSDAITINRLVLTFPEIMAAELLRHPQPRWCDLDSRCPYFLCFPAAASLIPKTDLELQKVHQDWTRRFDLAIRHREHQERFWKTALQRSVYNDPQRRDLLCALIGFARGAGETHLQDYTVLDPYRLDVSNAMTSFLSRKKQWENKLLRLFGDSELLHRVRVHSQRVMVLICSGEQVPTKPTPPKARRKKKKNKAKQKLNKAKKTQEG